MRQTKASLGIKQKANSKNKVYYVNRLHYRFTLPVVGADGKPIYKLGPNGQPVYNSRGIPEEIYRAYEFTKWQSRFAEEGYWSVFEVTPETDKNVAEYLEAQAASPKSEILTEKKYVQITNPDLGAQMEKEDILRRENERLTSEKSLLEQEIAKFKQQRTGGNR